MKSTKNKNYCKDSELVSILQGHFGKNMNLARIKFISLFLCALCRAQTVNYEKIATLFYAKADRASSLRRIQRFMAHYELCNSMIARLIVSILPTDPPFALSMDSTNWKFGELNINILVLAICYQGMAFPILFTMLEKRGNSNTEERIAIVDRFIALFGKRSIKHLTADREFVGNNWINYLNTDRIRYYIRIRNNFYVSRRGERIKAHHLFNSVKIGEFRPLPQLYTVGCEYCYLAASRMKGRNGEPELQIIISYSQPEISYCAYKERWEIETAFKSLKTSGFNIEDTHPRDTERIGKLFALVMVAFAWAYLIGLYIHNHIKPIRILKHGYKTKNFVKIGLEAIIAITTLGTYTRYKFNVYQFLSCS